MEIVINAVKKNGRPRPSTSKIHCMSSDEATCRSISVSITFAFRAATALGTRRLGPMGNDSHTNPYGDDTGNTAEPYCEVSSRKSSRLQQNPVQLFPVYRIPKPSTGMQLAAIRCFVHSTRYVQQCRARSPPRARWRGFGEPILLRFFS